MAIADVLDKACEEQVAKMFEVFVDNVAGATDKATALAEGAERFLNGLDVLRAVLAKAKEIAKE